MYFLKGVAKKVQVIRDRKPGKKSFSGVFAFSKMSAINFVEHDALIERNTSY